MKGKFMSKTEVISASLRTELHSTQSANSQPKPNDDFIDLHDFVFDDGENLASLKLHYLTLGTLCCDASGAIANGMLLLHGTAGSAADFAQAAFFDALYDAGKPLDLSRYFLVIPDAIDGGDSSKPSNGLHSHFPHYGYKDQVRAQHLLLERIGITHLKLVLGTSMGGMQTWLWGEMFPDDMDCLVAIASTPAAISGKEHDMVRDDQPSHSQRPSLEERRLSEGLAAEKLDQGGHTIIRDYDGIS
jgi:homoserine acetyltransferase